MDLVVPPQLADQYRLVAPEDLQDGLRYQEDVYERPWPAKLIFEGIEQMSPASFVEDMSWLSVRNLTPRGWLKEHPPEEWLALLRDEYERDFTITLQAMSRGAVHPAIQIDGMFADGKGRSQVFWSLGKLLPVAVFRSG